MLVRISLFVLVAGAVTALAIGLLRDDGKTEPKYSSVSEVMPDLDGADPRLKAIAAQANELLPDGPAQFETRLRNLHGLPIVANKWAHWCAPCRAEFPIFQEAAKELGGEVAFLGVNYYDSRRDARAFLDKFPVPYPSYEDPDRKLDDEFPPAGKAPITNIYDASGKLVYTEPGPFSSVADLREKLERYAGVKTRG